MMPAAVAVGDNVFSAAMLGDAGARNYAWYLMLRCGVLTAAQILLVFGLAHERDPLAKAFCHPALWWLGKLSYPVYMQYMLQVRKTPSWPREVGPVSLL